MFACEICVCVRILLANLFLLRNALVALSVKCKDVCRCVGPLHHVCCVFVSVCVIVRLHANLCDCLHVCLGHVSTACVCVYVCVSASATVCCKTASLLSAVTGCRLRTVHEGPSVARRPKPFQCASQFTSILSSASRSAVGNDKASSLTLTRTCSLIHCQSSSTLWCQRPPVTVWVKCKCLFRHREV